MNIDRMLGLTGLIFGLVPYAALLINWAGTRHPARSFLQLSPTREMEIIISTNSATAARPGEARTYTTALGEVRSVEVAGRKVQSLYKHKEIRVFMSEEYSGRLQADTLILGGPLRNPYAQRLIDYMNETYPGLQLRLDASSNVIGIGGRTIPIDQRRRNGIPREDLALLVTATTPWSDTRGQRVMLCAGLSTYGTEGATRLLFHKALTGTRDSGRLRHLLAGEASASIVRVWLDGPQVVRTELIEATCWSDRTAERPVNGSQSAPGPQRLKAVS